MMKKILCLLSLSVSALVSVGYAEVGVNDKKIENSELVTISHESGVVVALPDSLMQMGTEHTFAVNGEKVDSQQPVMLAMADQTSMHSTAINYSEPDKAKREARAKKAKQSSNSQGSEPSKGSLSGSFETNTIVYVDDKGAKSKRPDDNFGSNNYLKLDYTNSKFAAGVQLEGYYPVLTGYDPKLQGTKITNKYVTFTDKKFQITAGDFYDQFGNGLIFRSYEDRALGFNNSIEGARASYNTDVFRVKALWGRERIYMDYANGYVRGLDASLSIAGLCNAPVDLLDIEASVFSKANGGKVVTAYSGRLNFSHVGFALRSEYVYKDSEIVSLSPVRIEGPGNALLIDLGYTTQGFGVQLIGRRLENMTFLSDNTQTSGSNINYLPSLTLQNSYALGSINPYSTFANSEIGGQLDIYYNVPAGSAVGGKYGMKIHLNASEYHTLAENEETGGFKFFAFGDRLLWQEWNINIQKTFSKKFKGLVMVGQQKYNPMVTGKYNQTIYKQIFAVLDGTYKFNRSHALRLELQHLWSKDDQGNWAYATLEYSIAPRWSMYVTDMYNYGNGKTYDNTTNQYVKTKNNIHYYNVGFSYSQNRTRLALSYGRNREGMTCSGGVCRLQPAFTGLNFALTSSF